MFLSTLTLGAVNKTSGPLLQTCVLHRRAHHGPTLVEWNNINIFFVFFTRPERTPQYKIYCIYPRSPKTQVKDIPRLVSHKDHFIDDWTPKVYDPTNFLMNLPDSSF